MNNNNNNLKNTVRLDNNNNFEDSRDRVDLNLFERQSPVAADHGHTTATNSNRGVGRGVGGGRKK